MPRGEWRWHSIFRLANIRRKKRYKQFRSGADGVQTDAYNNLLSENRVLRRQINARYDSANTFPGNINHWGKADSFSPDRAASPQVRSTLRRRSRFEIIENNSWLRGTVITVCDDFAGNGVRLNVVDERLSDEQALQIEKRWQEWCVAVKMRELLWRSCMGKIVDGETFALLTINPKMRHANPLDVKIFEPECITSPVSAINEKNVYDGIRIDRYGNPDAYYLLYEHPGGSPFMITPRDNEGRWVSANKILHWQRKDRGWLRAVPELASSLPLCSVLRRYTMAELKKQEVNAGYTIFFETQIPTFTNPGDTPGGQASPRFDQIPITPGTAVALPWGTSAKEFGRTPAGQELDSFVGTMLREITRPLGVTFNLTVGTSKDSNMASAVVDSHIYKGSQASRRYSCEEDWLYPLYIQWFQMGCLIPGYFSINGTEFSDFYDNVPTARFYWNRIGIDHTDPQKVMNALIAGRDAGILLNEDIQQEYFNRDYKVWEKKIEHESGFLQKNPVSSQQPMTYGEDDADNDKDSRKNEKETTD